MTDGRARAFLAVPLVPAMRDSMVDAMDVLRPAELLSDARWASAESLHVTLHYLGDIGLARVADVARIAAEVCCDRPQFLASLSHVDWFPERRQAQIIAARFLDAPSFDDLAATLAEALVRSGFPRDTKRFIPHITLARLPDPVADPRPIEVPLDGAMLVTEIVIYQSRHGEEGHYSELARIPVGAAPESLVTPDAGRIAEACATYVRERFNRSVTASDLAGAVTRALFGETAGWASFVDGLITQEEVRDLVAAHVHTRLEELAEMPPHGSEWEGFMEAIGRTMFYQRT